MGRALLVLETPFDRQKAVNWIGKAPVGTRVEFKASKRTLPQNDLLWALLTEVSQQLEHAGKRYDPGQWKAIFLHAFGREISFLPSLDQRTFLPIELSSSDLSKDEMTDFIEFIMKESSERGVVFREHTNDNSNSEGDAPSPSEDDAPSASSESDGESPASSLSPLSHEAWLKTAARMLWSATHVTGDTDGDLHLLNNQRLAVAGLCPADTPQDVKDKAGSVYRHCKERVLQNYSRENALKIIANMAGLDVSELEA